MIFTLLMSLFSLSLDLLAILGLVKIDKDLEILILRQQVRILQRKVKTPPRISDPERMVLATLTDKYSQFTDGARQRLHQVMLIFKPDPVLRWHRELVRRKWTFKRKGKPGRPGRSSELVTLIVRLTKENPRWGYDKIQGELLKPGYNLSASSVRNTLKRHRLTPASERSSGSWGTTKTRSWLAISSLWKPYGSKPSMGYSSSNWEPAASIWQDARRTPTRPGLLSRLANGSGI
jgi:hypothetical protein